jgi:hemoglobin/transferrin/lactoferrin receptor protein
VRQLLLLLFFSLNIYFVVSQEITVFDDQTQERIPGVLITSVDRKIKILSDNQGRFRLEQFYSVDSVAFYYTGYTERIEAVSDLKKLTGLTLSDAIVPLSEMRVTANRWSKDRLSVPGRIEKIDLKNSGLTAPQTTADLLESSGYVFVQKSQQAGGSPQLRGFGTNRILIVMDGVRMNNAIFRSGNLQNIISIDPMSLEESEVIFGPGSVIFGSDAIGGVMDFESKKGIYSSDTAGRMIVKNRVYQRFSSASNELTSHYDISLGKRKWKSYTSFSFSKFGDLKAGTTGDSAFLRPTFQSGTIESQSNMVNPDSRVQVGSAYEQFNVLNNFTYKFSDEVELSYGFQYARTGDAPRYDRLILDSDGNDTLDFYDWYYGPQIWMLHRLELSSRKKTKLHDQIKYYAAYQFFAESRHDLRSESTSYRRQFEEVDAYSANLDLLKKVSKKFTVSYGAEFVLNKVASESFREKLSGEKTDLNPRYPNGSLWWSTGVYLNGEYVLTSKWKLEGGLRYSHFGIEAEFDTSLFSYPITFASNQNGALNGSLGVVYKPNSRSHFYMNLATGFRAPNIDDMGKVFDSEPGRVVVPNTNLGPEYAYNAEIGFIQTIGKHIKLDGAFYYTYLENALVRSPYTLNGLDSILYEGQMSEVVAIQNASDAFVYGLQAGVHIVLGKISIYSMINAQEGEQFENDLAEYYPLNHIMPLFGRTGIKFIAKQIYADLNLVYQGEMSYEDLPLQERGLETYAVNADGNSFVPSWYTLNFKAGYHFNKHLTLGWGIENIGDKLYRTLGSGISAPGRNIIVSLKAVF